MAWLFTDRRMLDHETPPRHPERPERLAAILRQLDRGGQAGSCRRGLVREATDDRSLHEKFDTCLRAINRDIVLATEVRD